MLRDNKTIFILKKKSKNSNYIKFINIIYCYVYGLKKDRKLAIKLILSSEI